jgi:phosphoenolpyruvate---glycerone phosphotransferase subunit DhaL
VNRDASAVTGATLLRWLGLCADSCREQRDYLTQLDAAIGDADHGANMDRGFAAVVEKLRALDEDASPGTVLATAGEAFVSTVGGASGALWGTALRRAGAVLGDDAEVDASQLAAALDGALAAIVELGTASEGDKTMVDALAPALRALHDSIGGGAGLGEALDRARLAGEDGMRATIPLQALKGRASYLRERSIGHQDPGATSTALILAALHSAVAAGR